MKRTADEYVWCVHVSRTKADIQILRGNIFSYRKIWAGGAFVHSLRVLLYQFECFFHLFKHLKVGWSLLHVEHMYLQQQVGNEHPFCSSL